MLRDNWVIFKNIDKLSNKLANDILEVAKASIKSRNSFKIVLTGGNSILNTYEILSNSESDWSKWHIYLGDERRFPAGDKDRNDYMINKAWLNNGLILKENIHFIQTELDVNSCTSHYENILKDVGYFDIVLLSVGEDGHVASLFPGHIYDNSKSVVVENNSPKYPKDRVTMTYQRLNKSNNVFKIINGNLKQDAVKLWLNEQKLPASEVGGLFERVYCCKNSIPFNMGINNG